MKGYIQVRTRTRNERKKNNGGRSCRMCIANAISARTSPISTITREIKDSHALITNGIYKTIRHPMYSSFALWSIAQCLLLQNYIAGFSTLFIDIIMYFIRIPKEEQMMIDQFGEEYREYMKQTGRLFPKIL